MLDICLVLHAEHGGGNNSTFTTHVISSTGTDTYSTVAGSLGSLKGPKHGGANLKVQQMMDDLKAHVTDWSDESALREYLQGLLDKKGFDHSGLIYGMGHAVYTKSDPRARILKRYAEKLAEEKRHAGGIQALYRHRKNFNGASGDKTEYGYFCQCRLLQRICIGTGC